MTVTSGEAEVRRHRNRHMAWPMSCVYRVKYAMTQESRPRVSREMSHPPTKTQTQSSSNNMHNWGFHVNVIHISCSGNLLFDRTYFN